MIQKPQNPDWKAVLGATTAEEAVGFFRQKGFRVGFNYQDVWQQEHQAAFTVAKAMRLDILQDIRTEVDKALASGTTFAQFQEALMPTLQKKGWWGKQDMLDPLSGETRLVQLGSPARLELIFDTNLATAHSEGQWTRVQRNKELFPYLEYVRSASLNPRHSHLAYAGLVLPVDDPFWQAHMPIKQYKCKCSVIQHSARTLATQGLQVGKAPPEVLRTMVNKRTGEVMQVPVGVDPSFHYPPGGRLANLEQMLRDKQAAASAYQVRGFVERTKGITNARHSHPIGPVLVAPRILAATGVDLTGYTSTLDNYAVNHTLKKHGNAAAEHSRGQIAVELEDFGLLSLITSEADAVQADGLSRYGLEQLLFSKLVGSVGYLVVQERRPGSKQLALVSMRKKKGAWDLAKLAE